MSTPIAISNFDWPNEVNYELVSEAARTVREAWKQKRNYLKGSASDWIPTINESLRNIKNKCGNPDWDGFGANLVSDQTIENTELIIEVLHSMLPKGTPIPDVIAEADGEICIDWTIDDFRLFSLSIGSHNIINFAGQYGKEGAIHGWQPVDKKSRDTVEKSLQDVVRQINRLFPNLSKKRRS